MPSGILDILHETENMSFLSGDPEVTYFRTIFRRYTPFSIEHVVEPAAGDHDYVATLSKAGDLVHRITLRAQVSTKKMIRPEPTTTSWSLAPDVLPTFQNILPLPKASSILTTYHAIINILEIKTLLLGNISDTQTYTSILNVEELITWFGNIRTYRAYTFLDFIDLLSTIQTKYNNGMTVDRTLMQEYKDHPIHKLVFLDGNTSRLLPYTLPDLPSSIAPYLFDSYYLEIGGTIVNQYSPYYYQSLNQVQEKAGTPEYDNLLRPTATNQGTILVHIPLLFYFCETSGVALPLCAMRYHDARIGVTATTAPFLNQVWQVEHVDFIVEYIHLSDSERLKFVTSNLEYVIHQVQEQSVTVPRGVTDITEELVFTRPCIELMWYPVVYGDQYANFASVNDVLKTCEVLLGGDVLGTEKDARYYRMVPAYESHSRMESMSPVYGFSFALDAESFQPSGSLNLGKIPHTYLKLSLSSQVWETDPYQVTVYVFSRCINVLRISNGFTELAFS